MPYQIEVRHIGLKRFWTERWREACYKFAVTSMKILIFGLSVSSSWGNGHATLWRGLIKALARRSHDVVFFEKDTPYYREHRDTRALPGCELRIYSDWESIASNASLELREADVGIVTSYCPD